PHPAELPDPASPRSRRHARRPRPPVRGERLRGLPPAPGLSLDPEGVRRGGHARRGRPAAPALARPGAHGPPPSRCLLGGEPDLPLERVPVAPRGHVQHLRARPRGGAPVLHPRLGIGRGVGTGLGGHPDRDRAPDGRVPPVPAAVHRVVHPVGPERLTARKERPMKRRALVVALVLGLVGAIAPATHAQTKLQFYYPVGVSGPLARIIDGYVQEWNQGHPQNQVEPVFAGSYTEAYSKT